MPNVTPTAVSNTTFKDGIIDDFVDAAVADMILVFGLVFILSVVEFGRAYFFNFLAASPTQVVHFLDGLSLRMRFASVIMALPLLLSWALLMPPFGGLRLLAALAFGFAVAVVRAFGAALVLVFFVRFTDLAGA